MMSDKTQSQTDKFKELARAVEVDEDESHWDDRLRELAKVKPEPEKPT